MWPVLSDNPHESGEDQANGTYRRWEEGCFIPSLEKDNSLPGTVQGPKSRLQWGGGGLQWQSVMVPWTTTLGPQANPRLTWVSGYSEHERTNEVWKDTRKEQGTTVTLSVEPESASRGQRRSSRLASSPSLEAEVHEG